MTLHESRRQMMQLAAIVIVCAIACAAISLVGFTTAHNGERRDRRNQAALAAVVQSLASTIGLQEQTAARTECVRARSSALDDARWTTIGALFSTSSRSQVAELGSSLGSLPTIATLENEGGSVGGKFFPACPPAIPKEKP